MATWSVAKVGPDGFAKVGRACYSLPWRFLGLSLDVRQTDAVVRFYGSSSR